MSDFTCNTDFCKQCGFDGELCKGCVKKKCYEQGRADAIEEYKLKLLNAKSDLVNDIHKAKIWVEFKRQAIDIAEQLKEQK